mgnify:CR=1 FL=1
MIIESIELQNYRNYDQLHMEFSPGTNILYGNNAQGKTNILEAVYVCCTTKSHRGSKDREMIRFQNDESHIKLTVRKRDVPYRIDMHLKKNKAKGVAINGIPIRRASELFGIVNVVFFSPEDLNLIKNGPAERRKFIDLELCQLNSFTFTRWCLTTGSCCSVTSCLKSSSSIRNTRKHWMCGICSWYSTGKKSSGSGRNLSDSSMRSSARSTGSCPAVKKP